MNDDDWKTTLDGFRACLPACGAKAKNDRLFLEALHFFAAHNITSRPPENAKNSVVLRTGE